MLLLAENLNFKIQLFLHHVYSLDKKRGNFYTFKTLIIADSTLCLARYVQEIVHDS